MSCDVGEVTSPTSQLILQAFPPTSQLILQPFFRFSYVTGSSLTLPGEPPMLHNACLVNQNTFFYGNYSFRLYLFKVLVKYVNRFIYLPLLGTLEFREITKN